MGTALEDVIISNSQHSLVINEIMLLLAEKRTSLASLRTGLGIVATPMSIVGFLVATSRFYDTVDVLHMLAPLWAACVVLFGLGMYMITRALLRVRRFDSRIEALKSKDSEVRALISVD